MNELLDFLIDSLEDSQRKLQYIIEYVKSDDYMEIYNKHHRWVPILWDNIALLRSSIDQLLVNIENEERNNLPKDLSMIMKTDNGLICRSNK